MTPPTWQRIPGDRYGGLEIVGPRFRVVQLRGPVFGPTYARQLQANTLRAVCYAEFHYNGSPNPRANYAEVILAPDRQGTRLGYSFLDKLATATGIAVAGCRVGTGSGNIARVHAPAILIEPGFVSNPTWAAFVRSSEGTDAIAKCLASAIHECFPEGGTVAFSVGHAYRRESGGPEWTDEDRRGDGGAPVADLGDQFAEDPTRDEEAELAEQLLLATGEFLAGVRIL